MGCSIALRIVSGGVSHNMRMILLAIMALSLHGLKAMVEICEEYAVEYDIKFNGQIIYLGVKLSKTDRYKTVVPEVSQFWKSFNILRAGFGAIPYMTGIGIRFRFIWVM